MQDYNLAKQAEQDIKDAYWDKQEMIQRWREESREDFDPFDYQPFRLDPEDCLDMDPESLWPEYSV